MTFKKYLYEKLVLGRNERVSISEYPITKIKDTTSQLIAGSKPYGLWYGFGDKWIYFSKNEMSDEYFSKKKYGYKVYINKNTVLSLTNNQELENFVDMFLTKTNQLEKYTIDWKKVSQHYSGIEMPNYDELGWRNLYNKLGQEYSFLYPWDIPSGCVWKPDGIIRLRAL